MLKFMVDFITNYVLKVLKLKFKTPNYCESFLYDI